MGSHVTLKMPAWLDIPTTTTTTTVLSCITFGLIRCVVCGRLPGTLKIKGAPATT